MRIAIIGKGHVGKALGSGLQRVGHEIRFGHRDPEEPVRAAAEWGEVIILAVPYSAVENAAYTVDDAVHGKVLIDVTNAIGPEGELAIGLTTSGAEELQRLQPHARVVKAFNTVFAGNMSSGRVGEEKLSAFLAGDDSGAKQIVMKLASDIGFVPVDVGPLKEARYLEPLGMLLIGLGFDQNMGTKIGFKLLKA